MILHVSNLGTAVQAMSARGDHDVLQKLAIIKQAATHP